MATCVNKNTGAGSELVATALQTERGAILMGGHTAGAGAVATVIPLPPLGKMSLTTQRITLASGQVLQPPGVLPQVALMPEKGFESASLETSSNDPIIVRLRRGITQTPQPGVLFDAPDTPGQDFEVLQACAALAMLPSAALPHPYLHQGGGSAACRDSVGRSHPRPIC